MHWNETYDNLMEELGRAPNSGEVQARMLKDITKKLEE